MYESRELTFHGPRIIIILMTKKRTGAAKTFDPIFARFFVETRVMPMLTFAAPPPAAFRPASGFNFSG